MSSEAATRLLTSQLGGVTSSASSVCGQLMAAGLTAATAAGRPGFGLTRLSSGGSRICSRKGQDGKVIPGSSEALESPVQNKADIIISEAEMCSFLEPKIVKP